MTSSQTQQPKAAIYVRISSLQGTVANQVEPLNQFASARGFQVVETFKDEGVSGAKERRNGLDQLLRAARRGGFKYCLVMELSRLARDLRHLLNTLHELNSLGVTLISVRESIEINDSPFSRGMVTMIGLLVQIERDLLRDRIKTALAVRKQIPGWRCGRPPKINDELIDAVKKLRAAGTSIRGTAKALNCSKTTVLRICQMAQNPDHQKPENRVTKKRTKNG